MTNADTEPEVLFLDYVKDGQCRLLVRWNIKEVEKEDLTTGRTHTSWDYSERAIWWVLPRKYNALDEILGYLDTVTEEIVNFATATECNHDGTTSKIAMAAKVEAMKTAPIQDK